MATQAEIKRLRDARAQKLIALYKDMSLSAKDICEAMGWDTVWPRQYLVKEIGRLRKRGYTIPHRQSFQTDNPRKYV